MPESNQNNSTADSVFRAVAFLAPVVFLGIVLACCYHLSRKKAASEAATSRLLEARQQVNRLAEEFSLRVDSKNHFVRSAYTEDDPWGAAIRIEYDTVTRYPLVGGPRIDLSEDSPVGTVCVISNGPDGIGGTADDIGATCRCFTPPAFRDYKAKKASAPERFVEDHAEILLE